LEKEAEDARAKPGSIEDFLFRWPDGDHADAARARIAELEGKPQRAKFGNLATLFWMLVPLIRSRCNDFCDPQTRVDAIAALLFCLTRDGPSCRVVTGDDEPPLGFSAAYLKRVGDR
jgi:hypothetical protein